MTRERLEELMVKVTDGVATAAEQEELMTEASNNPALARELDAHRALKAVTDGWVARLQLDLAEDRHREAPLARFERAVGVTAVVVASAVLAGGGVVSALLDPSEPLWVRGGLAGLVGGLLLLLFSTIRWRWATRKSDKYTEVIR